MSRAADRYERERNAVLSMRQMANQAFSRAAGAPLIDGNSVRLLKDAAENYPAWLKAIAAAERYIHFESYIIHEDEAGWIFAEALMKKAREGVCVRLVYDWMGGFGAGPCSRGDAGSRGRSGRLANARRETPR